MVLKRFVTLSTSFPLEFRENGCIRIVLSDPYTTHECSFLVKGENIYVGFRFEDFYISLKELNNLPDINCLPNTCEKQRFCQALKDLLL